MPVYRFLFVLRAPASHKYFTHDNPRHSTTDPLPPSYPLTGIYVIIVILNKYDFVVLPKG